jgi:hydrogenase maturation factor HypF (carbamoyltransferase family)
MEVRLVSEHPGPSDRYQPDLRLALADSRPALEALLPRVEDNAAKRSGVETVVRPGVVFQSRLRLERTVARLSSAGLRVLLSPTDGGISYGQAAVGAAASQR